MFPLSCICAEMEYSLCQVNWIVDGKRRIEGKHTVTTHVGRGSFLDNLANPGKAEGGGTTEKPVQYECYLACYHNKCKRTYMTEKVVFGNKENCSDSSFPFHCCKNNGTFSKNKVSKFHTNRMNCYFIVHIINLWW